MITRRELAVAGVAVTTAALVPDTAGLLQGPRRLEFDHLDWQQLSKESAKRTPVMVSGAGEEPAPLTCAEFADLFEVQSSAVLKSLREAGDKPIGQVRAGWTSGLIEREVDGPVPGGSHVERNLDGSTTYEFRIEIPADPIPDGWRPSE